MAPLFDDEDDLDDIIFKLNKKFGNKEEKIRDIHDLIFRSNKKKKKKAIMGPSIEGGFGHLFRSPRRKKRRFQKTTFFDPFGFEKRSISKEIKPRKKKLRDMYKTKEEEIMNNLGGFNPDGFNNEGFLDRPLKDFMKDKGEKNLEEDRDTKPTDEYGGSPYKFRSFGKHLRPTLPEEREHPQKEERSEEKEKITEGEESQEEKELAPKGNAVLLTCIDFRLHQRPDKRNCVGEFIFSLKRDCDLVTRAGGVLDLVMPHLGGFNFNRSILRDLKVALELHNAETIMLMNHENCGAYKHVHFKSREEELEYHGKDLIAARNILQKEFRGKEIQLFFAALEPGTTDVFVIKEVSF